VILTERTISSVPICTINTIKKYHFSFWKLVKFILDDMESDDSGQRYDLLWTKPAPITTRGREVGLRGRDTE